MSIPYPLPRQTRKTDIIAGDGRKTYGPFNFRIFDTADVVAMVSRQSGEWLEEPLVATKTAGQDYDTFSVTLANALVIGDRAVVSSERLHSRSVAVTRGGAIDSRALERELTTIGTVLQELRRDLGSSTAGAGDGDGGEVIVPPTVISLFATKAEAAATKIAADVSFVRTAGYGKAGDGGGAMYVRSTAQPTGAPAARFQDADGAWWRLAEKAPNVFMLGIVGDGKADDSDALQALYDVGGYVKSPFGTTIRTTKTIEARWDIIFDGDGCQPYTAIEETSENRRGPGSWFFFDHDGVGINHDGIDAGRGTSGLALYRYRKVGSFRAQPKPGSGAFTPVEADFDFVFKDCEFDFDDYVPLNPTRWVKGRPGRGGKASFNRIRGQPLKVGIDLDDCYHVARYDVDFWPFWSLNPNVIAFTKANLISLAAARVDGLNGKTFFSIFHLAGIVVSDRGKGTLNKAHFDWAYLDNGRDGVIIDATVDGATTNFGNLTIWGLDDRASFGFRTSGKNCRLTVGFFDGQTFFNQAIYLDGTNNRMQIGMLRTIDAGIANPSTPATFATASNTLILNGPKDFTPRNGNAFFAGAGALVEVGGGGVSVIGPIEYSGSPTSDTAMNVVAQKFSYTKIGRKVFVDYYVQTQGTQYGSGGVTFDLPFEAAFGAAGSGFNDYDGTQNIVSIRPTSPRKALVKIYVGNSGNGNGHPLAETQRGIFGSIAYTATT